MCGPCVPNEVQPFPATPAFHQHTIQTIQCRLILLRIAEIRQLQPDDRFKSVMQSLHDAINALTAASKQTRKNLIDKHHAKNATTTTTTTTDSDMTNDKVNTASASTPCLTTINAKLRKVKRQSLLTLVFTIRSRDSDPFSERHTLRQRVATFLAARSCPVQPGFRRVVRNEVVHFLFAFDHAVANLYWHRRPSYLGNGPPMFIRSSFLIVLLPRFQIVFPLPHDMLDCPICCDSFQHGCVATRFTVCRHAFHAACLDKWLLEQSDTCPMCRLQLHPLLSISADAM